MKNFLYNLNRINYSDPEEYEVYDQHENIVGRFTLNEGEFVAKYIGSSADETVYISYPDGDNVFEVYERIYELNKALEALHAKLVIEDKVCLY